MAETPRHQIAWLIEQPETDSMPVRWWHPVTGWMRDANKALWCVRKEDAEAILKGDRLGLQGIATEHKFVSAECNHCYGLGRLHSPGRNGDPMDNGVPCPKCEGNGIAPDNPNG